MYILYIYFIPKGNIMATSEKITKATTKDFVKRQLSVSEKWATTALLRIYDYQTNEEQRVGYTKFYNGVGFTGADSEILSSFAEQLLRKGFLSPKQTALVMKKMPKYWNQIISISDIEKLKLQVAKSLIS